MAAAAGDFGGYGWICHKVIGGGLWRCTRLAMSGNPFCEAHYAMEVKKIQHMMRGEKEVVNEGGGARKRGKPNDDGMIRPKAEGVLNKRDNIRARQGHDDDDDDELAQRMKNEIIQKRGRGRPRKVETNHGLNKGKEKILIENNDCMIRRQGCGKPNDLVNKGKEKVLIENDDCMIRRQGCGARQGDEGPSHVVRQSGGPIPAKKKEKIINGSENIKKRGRGRPKKDSKDAEIAVCRDNIKKRGRGRPKKVQTKPGMDARE